jgi:hypothetical protein
VLDRVDLHGLMRGGSDPTDPAYDHPILGERGLAVPDTWMGGLLSGQEMLDTPGASSPGKAAASHTKNMTTSLKGSTFMSPAKAAAAGGKEMTTGAMWGMQSLAAVQDAARIAREPESQTNIPPVMIQEMPWVHVRGNVADSAFGLAEAAEEGTNMGTTRARVSRLTGGSLAGNKEFRPPTGDAPVQRMERPGTFFRGYDNPLDTDTVTVIPGNAAASPQHAESLVGRSRLADIPEPTPMAKRRAIKSAQKEYKASRTGGSAWSG